jgi:hypothetical protein
MAPNEKGGPKAAPHLLVSTIIITNPALRLSQHGHVSPTGEFLQLCQQNISL